MASLYLPIRALNRSSGIRINKQRIVPGTTYYIDINATGVAKELAYHSSVGQVFVVGALTASPLDQVVTTGATATVSNLVVTVAAGETKVRSTGAFVAVAGGTATLAAADATKDRTDLVWVKASDGTVGWSKGILATAGASVAPTAGIGASATFSGTTANTSNVITTASTAGLAVGQAITGTNIPNNNWITEITSATAFKVAYNCTGAATSTLTPISTVGNSTWLVAATLTAATVVADVRPRS